MVSKALFSCNFHHHLVVVAADVEGIEVPGLRGDRLVLDGPHLSSRKAFVWDVGDPGRAVLEPQTCNPWDCSSTGTFAWWNNSSVYDVALNEAVTGWSLPCK